MCSCFDVGARTRPGEEARTAGARRELRAAPRRGAPAERRLPLKERLYDAAILVDALGRIADGESVVDPRSSPRLLGRHRRADPLAELTDREREVLALVAEFMSNRAMATSLVVTECTVEAHVTPQMFVKLGLGTNPDSHRRVLAVLAYLRAAG
jgi:DNA-binding NarL/FixJ family response regulator